MEIKLLGNVSKETIESQINICAAACKLSRMPGKVFDALESTKDYDKALAFVKRVVAMGHTATVDHDYMVFALSEVSPLVEQTIIAERFSSFTIKSRREVDFSKVGFYTPDFRNEKGNIIAKNDVIQTEYKEYMDSLFETYDTLVQGGIPKEDARFILPYSYHSEIIMGLDATALVRMITKLTKGKASNISELKEFGEKIYEIAKVRAPYIETLVEAQEIAAYSEVERILDELVENKSYNLVEGPTLISYTENVDETIFVNAISRIYSLDYKKAKNIYDEKIRDNEDLKKELMRAIANDYERDDLRQINFRFQLSIPFAILTHYTRHRRASLSIPEFVPIVDLDKFVVPPSISKNKELNELYNEAFRKNTDMYEKFKNMGIRPEDLVYFTLSGHAVNVIINYDGEAFRTFSKLRSCTKAQWYIRENTVKMINKIKEVSDYYSLYIGPDCVTKHTCGEGKESCGRLEGILKSLNK